MEHESKRVFNLEERTLLFAKAVREFVKILPSSIANREDGKQLVRSSGSIGANYIEANESLSKKDFIMRAKIARKEAKESVFWLKMFDALGSLETRRTELEKEAGELVKILSAILLKTET